MRSKAHFIFSVLLAVLVFASLARAQSTTDGAIGGTVTDPSGAVVPDALIKSRNLGTGVTSSGVTDGSGRYLLIRLQPGSYSLEISAGGFSTFAASNIVVEVGRATTMDATLGVKGTTETVVATAELPVITSDRADFSTNINQTEIDNLPMNGRRWSFFALSTPGATPDGNFGLVSFRGISGLLNNNTVDGADNNQAFFSEERGRTRISYSTSEASIQEFQVNTSNYSAEYGRAAGGVVNAVTKSGSNSLHGEAFWFFRNSDWGAINPFQTHLVNNLPTPFLPENKRHQFGGGIGGPILKDRLFFFFSGDQQLQAFPAVANSGTPGAIFAPLSAKEISALGKAGIAATDPTVGSALTLLRNLTGTVPRTGDQLVLLPKIDWVVNSKNRVSISYNRFRWASPEGIQTGPVVNRGIESFGNDYVKDDWVIARVISTFTNSMTNEFRYQHGRDFEFENGQSAIAGEPISQLGVSPQISVGGVGGFTFGMPNFLNRPAFPDETRNQVADTLAWSRGTHLLKFGFDINHVYDNEINLFEGFGAYSYSSRTDFISDFVAAAEGLTPRCTTGSTTPVAAPCYASYAQGFGTPGFNFTTNDLAFFIQDDWRIRPHLTLNLGLRWDTELMPSPQIPNSAVPLTNSFPSDHRDFGPRLGFAWDIFGGGKTILRGGYGIFYGRIINSTIFNAIANTGVSAGQNTISPLPGQTGAPLYPNVIASGSAPPGLNVIQFAPNSRLPLIQEYDLEIERQIATNTVVSLSYVGSAGGRLPRFVDTNLAPTLLSTTYNIVGGPLDGQAVSVPYFGVPADKTGKKPASGGTGRPNTAFGAITDISYSVNSNYNALVAGLNRRFYRNLQVQSAFTWSRANDYGQASQTFTATNNVLNPFNLQGEYSRSNFDIRDRFTTALVWTPDYYTGQHLLLKELLNGFTISPLIVVSSGAPFTPLIQGNAPASQTINGIAYVTVTGGSGILGAGGTNRPLFYGPNSFQMPRTANVDLRLQKAFTLRENWKFTLSGDAFNLFNHNNITAVDTQAFTICAANAKGCPPTVNQLVYNNHFGVPTGSSNSLLAQRQIQIGAKLDF